MKMSQSLKNALIVARGILAEARNEYQPIAEYALFSGGHDSLSVTHWAMSQGADAAAHINTGIGIEKTRQFVRDTCERNEWALHEESAAKRYEDIVRDHGFPGPNAHRYMYILLKARGVDALVRKTKSKRMDKVLLITGVRKQESIRRMGTVKPIQQQGAKVWVAPFLEMTKADVNEYLSLHNVQRNEVVDCLHMSGECLCGAFAHKGELDEIRFWYPEVAEEIERLEVVAAAAGKPWRWEDAGPPDWYNQMQAGQQALGFENDPQMLCTQCNHRHALLTGEQIDE